VEPLGGKWRPPIGKVREWYVESWHHQVCSPRLCRLRTDGLAPASKYWTYRSHASVYGSSKPSSLLSIVFGFLHCFIGWLEREIGYGPMDRSASVLCIVSGAHFLRSSDSVQCCRWRAKGCYMWTTWDTYGPRPYVDCAWKACDMLVGFSSAGCTSIWIIATLGYE
jgi:hypothetical protein